MKSLNHLIQTMVGVLLWGLASPLAAAEPRIPNEKPVYHGLLEKQFADIEAKVPGFAGWYFDDDGNAVIRLKDISRERDAMDHLGSLLDTRRQAGRGPAAERKGRPHMKARPAMFSFSELAAFREAIFQVFPDGLYSIDLDERTNVVSLGVRDEEVMRKIHGLASRFHIPAAALHMEITSMAESRYSLTDYQRPLRGGVGFIFNSQSGCTIGVNGYWIGPPGYTFNGPRGFITASHCTSTTWSMTGNAAFQEGPPTKVATELVDPTPWTGTNSYGTVCPPNVACRYSDTAFYSYDNIGESYGGGTIAETADWANGSPAGTDVVGYMNVSPNDYPEGLTPLAVGDALDKMGSSSGWTWGDVAATCLDLAHRDRFGTTLVVLLCQDRVNIYSEAGDSGSPVFKWYSPGQTEFAGILWGGPSCCLTQSYISSAFSVNFDLGFFWKDYSFY